MGVVYHARHQGLNRPVALKMILVGAHADPAIVARFWSETQTVAKLQHPGIVQVFDSGWCDGLPYCALELLPGGTLAERLEGQPWAPRKAAELVLALARTIHAAHQAGVVHRDLKPANILFTADGQPKVGDFGVAKDLRNPMGGYTQSGDIIGTPAYMAPEQASGSSKEVGPASDVYAMGVLLYELLTGDVPFVGQDPVNVLIQVRQLEPVPPRRRVHTVPVDLDVICLKCLEKDPAQRYSSAQALADDLQRFLADRPIQARRVGDLEKVFRWGRRNPLVTGLAVMVGALFVLMFGLLVASYWRAETALQVEAHLREEAQQRERAERWERYRANISAAATGLQLHNVGIARQALEAAPEAHRNWEWKHFSRELDGAQRVFRWPENVNIDAAWTPDGSCLLLRRGTQLQVWNTLLEKETASFQVDPASTVQLSPDGRSLAIVQPDRSGILQDVATGKVRATFSPPENCVTDVRFSPDGSQLLVRCDRVRLQLWDTATGQPIRSFPGEKNRIAVLDWSADGRILALVDRTASTIVLWNTQTGERLQSWACREENVRHGLLNRTGEHLLIAESYPHTTLQMWDTKTGKQVGSLVGHENQVGGAAFTSDGRIVATASMDQTVRLWDVPSGKLRVTLRGHRGWVEYLRISPDGERVLSASQDHTVRIWSTATGELLAILVGHTHAVSMANFTRDGKHVISAGSDHTVRVWDLQEVERNGVLKGHTNYAYGVAFHPDGRQVASCAWDGTVRVWNATTCEQTALFQHEAGTAVSSVAFAPSGRFLASCGRDNSVRIWDLATGQEDQRWNLPTNDWRDSRVAFSPRGDLLACGGADRSLRLWDPAQRREVAILRGHTDAIRDVAFSPDGRWLASAGANEDRRLLIWDVAEKTQVHALEGHTASLYCLAFSPDGKTLASGSLDGTVRLWDTTTWEVTGILKHGSNVYGVAWSPNGTRLASACANNSIRFWDVATQQEVAELRGHEQYVHAVAFSPDGTRLASASGDRTVRIWDTLTPPERAARDSQHLPR
jgi:WD40 repeat protein